MKKNTKRRPAARRRKKRTGLIVLCVILGVILIAAAAAYFYIQKIRSDPKSALENAFGMSPAAAAVSATTVPAAPSSSDVPESAAPEQESADPGPEAATPDPGEYEALRAASSDTLLNSGILNVLLIGIDYSDERATQEWLDHDGSTSEHADVMIVLAINPKEQTVDMISVPRDTYTLIPNVQGIYKMNASLDCGGGLFQKDKNGNYVLDGNGKPIPTETDAGLKKVCESCSWILGGVPIDYYYAVTMPAVKELVNAIGGVDYDLELSFTMMGRSYQAGHQHMDGQAVLDYLRVRKSGSIKNASAEDVGDDSRVNRQKDMLIAILNQLRRTNTLLKIPQILNSFKGQLFTNCGMDQTTTLALYAFDMPSENIRMRSMTGIWGETERCANQHFYFLDPDKRVSLIREVYGIEVPKNLEITRTYGYFKWSDLTAARALATSYPLTKDAKAKGAFRPVYKNLQLVKSNAERRAESYLAGEDESGLIALTNELDEAIEQLKDVAATCDKDGSYKMDFKPSRILKDYNEIDVDPT